jgi:hypothetical protein
MSNSQNDLAEDIKKLWDCLKEDRMNQARLLHIHLKKVHNMTAAQVRQEMELLGIEKVVTAATERIKETTM